MNTKFIIKIEAGPLEQVYKVAHEDVAGLEDLKNRIGNAFLEKVEKVFLSMRDVYQGNLSASN